MEWKLNWRQIYVHFSWLIATHKESPLSFHFFHTAFMFRRMWIFVLVFFCWFVFQFNQMNKTLFRNSLKIFQFRFSPFISISISLFFFFFVSFFKFGWLVGLYEMRLTETFVLFSICMIHSKEDLLSNSIQHVNSITKHIIVLNVTRYTHSGCPKCE